MVYQLPALPYAYEALDPVIDPETMHLHHDKHHQAYLERLNDLLESNPSLANLPLAQLLGNPSQVPESAQQILRNHSGGYYNHNLFWESMRPFAEKMEPEGELLDGLETAFGSVEHFMEQFHQAGMKHFGSGWVWLVIDSDHKLQIVTTANQDTVLAQNLTPILLNDLWEHAYYLKYHNLRAEYLKKWWEVVNWRTAEKRFLEAKGV